MFTVVVNLRGKLMRFLTLIHMIDPVRVKSRAFDRLQTRLFREAGVLAVAVRGFASADGRSPLKYGDEVSVTLTKSPDPKLKQQIETIFFKINLRHGTSLAPVLMCRDMPDIHQP